MNYYTMADLARMSGESIDKVRKLILKIDIAKKVGHRWLVPASLLESALFFMNLESMKQTKPSTLSRKVKTKIRIG